MEEEIHWLKHPHRKQRCLKAPMKSEDKERKLLILIAQTVGLLFEDLEEQKANSNGEMTFNQEICAELWELHRLWKDSLNKRKSTVKSRSR